MSHVLDLLLLANVVLFVGVDLMLAGWLKGRLQLHRPSFALPGIVDVGNHLSLERAAVSGELSGPGLMVWRWAVWLRRLAAAAFILTFIWSRCDARGNAFLQIIGA